MHNNLQVVHKEILNGGECEWKSRRNYKIVRIIGGEFTEQCSLLDRVNCFFATFLLFQGGDSMATRGSKSKARVDVMKEL